MGWRPSQPRSKWTADTERAFLAALRLCGQAKKAAAEIGRSSNSAYTYRKRHPEFARRWDEAIAEQQREWIAAHQARLEAVEGTALDVLEGPGANGGGRLTPGRSRAGGWDARKRGLFLRTLKRTKNVAEACAMAKVSADSAYRLKAKSVPFAAAWERHVADAKPPSVLEAAIARAVDGWDEPIVQGGKVIAWRKRYSDVLLRDLLRAERGDDEVWAPGRDGRSWNARNRGRGQKAVATEAETDAAIIRKLDALDRRAGRDAAEAQERDWKAWKASWSGRWGFDAGDAAVA